MSRLRAPLGVSVTAAVLAALPATVLTAPAHAATTGPGASTAASAAPAAGAPGGRAAAVVQRVTPGELGPAGPWLRLGDSSDYDGRPLGVQEIAPFADPVHFNGSLHLAVARDDAAQQAQAAHYFTAAVPLSVIDASPLSYDLYVKSSSSDEAEAVGANLQLPVLCQGLFATLSFQPQLATDAQGRTGAVTDAWRHFDTGGSAMWRTSRAVGPFAAQSDHPLSDYVSACDAPGDGAIGVIANVGRLGDPGAALDTYVDNITVDGTVYDFATGRTAQGRISVQSGGSGTGDGTGGYGSGSGGGYGSGDDQGEDTCVEDDGVVTFTSPADGPDYRAVGTRLVLSGPGLTPESVTVTANGAPVTLTEGPDGTLTAVVAPDPEVDLAPGGTFSTPFTVTFDGPRHGPVTLTAELLAQGYEPLQPTGVTARTELG
ncbi:hypothetical protein SAMN05216223_101609 [Actinacidiphila yanglinensis]|uniref:Htaa protein n=1 Tax=Actinacidiphila yanglinensis TaxID=310779 RepID=A0A1H5TRN1_9ACTN|nr:hypothetical protein [Actinacidiphila yanglinensis]SEF64878.1 hypothetical protein SAMN05216223_101609 [Actinacidiphila yanglinensis]